MLFKLCLEEAVFKGIVHPKYIFAYHLFILYLPEVYNFSPAEQKLT